MMEKKNVVKTGKTNLSKSVVNKGHSGEEAKIKVVGKKC
jgi:hypothetical protein